MNRHSASKPKAATVGLADEEAVREIITDTLFGLWATVNNLTQVRPSRRERYRVTIFGSARLQPGHWVYEEVKQMCSDLSDMDCDIVTGGGPGLMQAANEGAQLGQAKRGARASASVSACPSSSKRTPSWSRSSNMRRFSRGCTNSYSCPMRMSWRPEESRPCSNR